jgi:hypothetical protein
LDQSTPQRIGPPPPFRKRFGRCSNHQTLQLATTDPSSLAVTLTSVEPRGPVP